MAGIGKRIADTTDKAMALQAVLPQLGAWKQAIAPTGSLQAVVGSVWLTSLRFFLK
jgi:hypothetical protein